MDPAFGLLIPAGVVVATAAYGVWQRSRWAAAVQEVGRELGIHVSGGGIFSRSAAHGDVRGNAVSIALITVGSGKDRRVEMHLAVRCPEGYSGLKLVRESVFKSIAKVISGDDVHAGDDAFDRAVHVSRCAEPIALSWLDRRVRSAAMKAIDDLGAKLESGMIELSSRSITTSTELLRERMNAMLALADALSAQPKSVTERLLRNATHDPDRRVRARNLRVLLASFPDSDQARDAIAACASDAAPEVRVIAAAARGEAGLRELVELACDAACSRAERIEACERIGPLFLTSPIAQPRAAAAQTYLISRLADDDSAIVEAAARALGQFATIDAVEPLQRPAKALLGGAVKEAARTAIAAIQTRGGGEGGRLSLVSPGESGRLSFATEADAGALSTVDE